MAGSGNTKLRAMDTALELFSQRGYYGVSMADIAEALGIKSPSLYKYFRGKDDLYAALTTQLEAHYTDLWDAVMRRQTQLEHDLTGVLTLEQLERETMAWLQGEMEDPQAIAFRRLLTLNQGQSPTSATHWLWVAPMVHYETFFAALVSREVLRRGEPRVMAMEYLAPLFRLLTLGDCVPDQRAAYLEEARAHIRQFHRIFARREQPAQGGGSPVSRLFRR